MTHSIALASILIPPSRQRRDFDPEALTDLANSISQRGLLHPIVTRGDPSNPVLVAGERRLRAIESLEALGIGITHNGTSYAPGMAPFVTLGELTPLEAEEAELDENLKREDLSWQEEAAAVARLHALRVAQAALVGESHSIADTAKELNPDASEATGAANYAHSSTRQKVLLADHLDNPEVAAAKSAKDAFKLLRKQEDQEKNRELAARIGPTFNSSVHSLIHADCLEWLPSIPDNSYDVILIDPPYGMGADSFGDGAGKLVNSEHGYPDSYGSWVELISVLCPQLWRVAKPQSHAYIFCDIDNFHELKAKMGLAGWYCFRTPLTVYKLASGRVPLPEQGPRRQSEWILYAIKGWRPVTAIYSDVIPCKLEENLGHGANKPIELYIDLLRRSIRPGDTVLDCFAGTGTIFPAAHALKVKAIGVEMSAEYYGIAVRRLNALDEEPAML